VSTLAVGTRLGPYEILSPLGAGGMGEVYRAHDTRLKRAVAIKVLAESLSIGADRAARFQREAELLATLNHPNIASIYGLELSDGTAALVLELVEGETLAQLIARGPMPAGEALPIARQISEALEAAHDRGVVHRDLKPANVIVTPAGQVKVLDFGLAKMLESDTPAPTSMTMSPTLSVPATMAGVILGTAAYMSPEQARGKATDRRTDVWSFGCVLYEMLTGKMAFEPGETISDAIVAVLSREPDWDALPPSTPRQIRALLRRCLQKDVSKRLPHLGVARLEIDEAVTAPDAPAAASHSVLPDTARRGSTRLAWAAAALFLLMTIAVGAFAFVNRHPVDPDPIRFVIAPPDGWRVDTTLGPTGSSPRPLAVSPDGRAIAFVARNATGKSQIWVRALERVTPTALEGTDGASSPFWSPDSRYIGFFADGKLKKIRATGGPPFTLCDASSSRGAAWSREGVIIFAGGGGLQKVAESGGVPTSLGGLAPDERDQRTPAFLSDGRHFVYYSQPGGAIRRASIDSADRSVLLQSIDAQNVVESNGHLLFVRGRTLMAQPFDGRRLALTGEPVPLADSVFVHTSPPVALFSASRDALIAYQAGSDEAAGSQQLVWMDETGRQLSAVARGVLYGEVELSPDGSRMAVTAGDVSVRSSDVWLFDVDRRVASRFTADPATESTPVWSPDGRRIVFSSNRKGHLDLYQKDSNGASDETVLLSDGTDKSPESWSRDGRFLLYGVSAANSPTHTNDVWVLPLDGERKPFPFLQSRFSERYGRFSPDGKWVTYESNESGSQEIYVTPFPGPGGKWRISEAGGRWARWRRDGRQIFYLAPDNKLMAVEVAATGDAVHVGTPRVLFDAQTNGPWPYDVTPDGKRFIVHVDTQPLTAGPITVITNWPAALQAQK
jgi:Tol biopolymer transport system component